MPAPSELAGRRILLVEDEVMVAMFVQSLLEDLQCEIIGPYTELKSALAAAENIPIDLGLLNIELHGQSSFEVADALYARGIPFIFMSGHGEQVLPAERPDWILCRKPFRGAEITALMIEKLLRHQASS
jgi:DNA-binding response OmpR family regulator